MRKHFPAISTQNWNKRMAGIVAFLALGFKEKQMEK
jgi:hypothetical protein